MAAKASDYLDKQLDTSISLQMRLHLMMCAHCRRFIRHLRLTQALAREELSKTDAQTDPEQVLRIIKQRERQQRNTARPPKEP